MAEIGTEMKVTAWPALPWEEWEATATTLHMWTQIVGKTRLKLTPLQNHWWNVPLYVTARGLSTSAMPCGEDDLDIEFDFISHELHFRLSSGKSLAVPLRAQSVADFYSEYLASLASLGVKVKIDPMPCELANPIRFDLDTIHDTYDREQAHRFWQVLRRVNGVFKQFSCGFVGKISPVHFFWGSFDLAVTRFSGRVADGPPRPDFMQQEAYSHEVSSLGFWPGNGGFGSAAFYSYAAPVPAGMSEKPVLPDGAGWNTALGEFLLKYDDVREQVAPEQAILEFAQSSYEAAADAAKWDRAALERTLPPV
jgi:Family of unknown function (DUF5996)